MASRDGRRATPAKRSGSSKDGPSKSEATRERIVSAAAQVLAERGYAGSRLADIAERADLQAGSLYYHFRDRDDLVDEVLRRGTRATFERVRRAVEAAGDDATPLDRLRTAIETHLSTVLEIGDVASAGLRVMGQLPPELRSRYQNDQRLYGDYWNGLIAAASDAGEIRADLDPVALRLFVIGALNWVVEWPRSALRPAPELAEIATRLLLDGLRLPPA